jgi:hypothetical protein
MFNSMLFHEGAGRADRVAGKLPVAIFFQLTELIRWLWRTLLLWLTDLMSSFFKEAIKHFLTLISAVKITITAINC